MELVFRKKFNNSQITIIQNGDEVLFRGKSVAIILGYRNTTKALRVHVDKEDKIMLKNIKNYGGLFGTPAKMQQDTIFINESGLYSLILRSKLPAAKTFKNWVTKEVLPSIRKTGKYEIPKKELTIKEKLSDIKDSINLIKNELNLKISERDAIMFKDRIMDINFGNKMITQAEKGREIYPLSDRIVFLGFKYNRNKLVKLGKICKQAYIAKYKKEPLKRQQFIDGATRMVLSYDENEYIDCLDKVIQNNYNNL